LTPELTKPQLRIVNLGQPAIKLRQRLRDCAGSPEVAPFMSVPVEQSLLAGQPAFAEGLVDEEMLTQASRQAAERERLALAQALHDTLCQSLSGIRLVVSLAERKATQRCPEMAGDLTEIHGMLHTVCNDVHKLVEELRTPARQRSHPILKA
jgi:signal transduction histidine kinase